MKEEIKTKIVLTAIGSIPMVLGMTTKALVDRKHNKQMVQRQEKIQELNDCKENALVHLDALAEQPGMTEEEIVRAANDEVAFLRIVSRY